MDQVITSTAGMDLLVGAEIADTYRDFRGNYHAVAVLNRARTLQLYSEMVRANQEAINNLVNISGSARYSLEGFARFQLAATIADVTASYAHVLSFLGAPVRGLKTGDELRLEAQNINRAIPVGITVRNDRAGRIQGAFAKAFSDLGFMSGGHQSRYVLNVEVHLSPADFPGSNFVDTRFELSANLLDREANMILLPFSYSNRARHTSRTEADNRAFLAMERIIEEQYAELLGNFLSRLMPGR